MVKTNVISSLLELGDLTNRCKLMLIRGMSEINVARSKGANTSSAKATISHSFWCSFLKELRGRHRLFSDAAFFFRALNISAKGSHLRKIAQTEKTTSSWRKIRKINLKIGKEMSHSMVCTLLLTHFRRNLLVKGQ